jgi:glutamate-ammonia-ligase adenylyltransferase
MTSLAARLEAAVAGTPLQAHLSGPAAVYAERRGDDAAHRSLSDPVLSGLARVIASQPEMAGFLGHRSEFIARLVALAESGLDARARSLDADAKGILDLDLEAALDALRIRRREEMAIAACADLAGLVPFEQVSRFLSELAESTAHIALDLAHREVSGPDEEDFAVIGMGKLAGKELTYHSDLDLIFLYGGGPERVTRASRIGQRLISYLTTMTGAGVAYEVDTRLRPSGRQGMLVTSFDAFERYQLREAQTWEHLAQLRGRVIGGAAQAADVLERVHAHILADRAPAWRELAELRERVRIERADEGGGRVPFKTGAGGLMDVDFLAGGGLLERGTRDFPAEPSVPAMLRACASGERVEALLADYQLLREVEARARWIAGRPVESIGSGEETLPIVAELVEPGLSSVGLLERLTAARRRIRTAYAAVIDAESLDALEDSHAG